MPKLALPPRRVNLPAGVGMSCHRGEIRQGRIAMRAARQRSRARCVTWMVLLREGSSLRGGTTGSAGRETRFFSRGESPLLEEVPRPPPGRAGSATTKSGLSLEASSLLPSEERPLSMRRTIRCKRKNGFSHEEEPSLPRGRSVSATRRNRIYHEGEPSLPRGRTAASAARAP